MFSPLPIRLALVFALSVGAAFVPVAAAEAPTGQFQPQPGDRDGDGAGDGRDCAPDDPSRPARDGEDADCDGTADPRTFSADSSNAVPMATLRAAARREAQVPVVAIAGAGIGPAALFGPREAQPLLVFAGREAMRVSARPILVYADGRRVKVPRSWSAVGRGETWAMRVRRGGAERVELAITVRDGAGTVYRTTRAIYG
jgi:hypothetical protein